MLIVGARLHAAAHRCQHVAHACPGASCRPRSSSPSSSSSSSPQGVLGWAISIPAAITLLATGARLAIALRESREAAEAFQLAQTDDLTGLPNRRAVLRALDDGIAGSAPLGLMLLDLDGFKEVNDTLGHSAGDTLLELVALRMRDSLPPEVMLARIGGDEFAILVPGRRRARPARAVRRPSARPSSRPPRSTAWISRCMPRSASPSASRATPRAADLLRRADVAMYEAKVTRAGAQLYDAQRDEFSRQRLRMGEELRRALHKGHIVVWYQPKVDAVTQMVIGMEALVRWEHPERGMIPPMAFLSVARRSGLMQELSEVVARQAVADARAGSAWASTSTSPSTSPRRNCSAASSCPLLFEAIDKAGDPVARHHRRGHRGHLPRRPRAGARNPARRPPARAEDIHRRLRHRLLLARLPTRPPITELKMDRSLRRHGVHGRPQPAHRVVDHRHGTCARPAGRRRGSRERGRHRPRSWPWASTSCRATTARRPCRATRSRSGCATGTSSPCSIQSAWATPATGAVRPPPERRTRNALRPRRLPPPRSRRQAHRRPVVA